MSMSSRRILILRADNIGDVVLFSGALQHIRNLYPEAHITLAVQSHIVNLVELCPYIDTCVAIDHLTWWGKTNYYTLPLKYMRKQAILRSLNRFLNVIRRPFDTIIYPIKSPQIYHLDTIYCLRPGQAFGITGCSLNAPEKTYPPELQPEVLFADPMDISKMDPWVHEFYTTLDFLRYLGCPVTTIDDIKPRFWLSDTEKNHLDGIQRKGRKIIGLFPGASFEGKCWTADNYGTLATLIEGRTIYAIFGSHADKPQTDRVALAIRERCADVEILNFTGQTTLRELARTVACCDLFISMDSSGLHMAITANVPTIGIVGGGHFGRFVPWGDPAKHIFLTQKLDCFHCNWHCCKDEMECVRGVSPHEVAIAANNLLHLRESL